MMRRLLRSACVVTVSVIGCGRQPMIRPSAHVGAVEHRPITTAPQKIDLTVRVVPHVTDDPRLEIAVRASSDDLPRRFVVQKKWAGDEQVLAHMSAPRAECDGAPVALAVEDLESHMGWTTARACQTVVVQYVLRPPKPELEWGSEFDVVAHRDLVSAIAESTLLLPDVPDETRARMAVEFDLGALPAGSEGVYSLGPGTHETTMRALRHAYLAAGRCVTIKHQAGNLTLEARSPVSADIDVAPASRDLLRFLDAENRLFGDDHPETLRVLIVGMPGNGGAHGTSLTASAMVWRDRADPWTAEDARLVGHEMFHLYNGQIIERTAGTGADSETYWFSEGFTEHYTDELLRRGGVTNAYHWLDGVRDRLRRYHHHPDCETPNGKADMRWGGTAVQLPYLRGSLIAAYVDYVLRRQSGGARSLDDVMRGLLARARRGESPIDPEGMLRVITNELGETEGALVRAVALDGQRLLLPKDAFGACVEVRGSGAEQDLFVRAGVDLEACMRAGG
jgi:hypothetical protein